MSAQPPKAPKSTPWRPGLWERKYRGVSIWVEHMYSTAPEWNWTSEWDAEGRAKTRQTAMKAAEQSVDKALDVEP